MQTTAYAVTVDSAITVDGWSIGSVSEWAYRQFAVVGDVTVDLVGSRIDLRGETITYQYEVSLKHYHVIEATDIANAAIIAMDECLRGEEIKGMDIHVATDEQVKVAKAWGYYYG